MPWIGRLRSRLAPAPDHRPESWRIGAPAGRDRPAAGARWPLEALTPAAVLMPVVDRPTGPTVLLTVRAAHLRQHAGQISFPGGRLESADAEPAGRGAARGRGRGGHRAALGGTIGFLPDQVVLTGFRITPVVARMRPGVEPALDRAEVASVFELPLDYVLEPATTARVRRRCAESRSTSRELAYGEHRIWGATAGILLAACTS